MKWVKRLVKFFAILLLLVIGLVVWTWWYITPDVDRLDKVTYTQRQGQNLTFDILHPANKKNRKHIGIILMNSGKWKSNPKRDRLLVASPLIRHGYSVICLSHMSQPKATVMEIVTDIHRAVRFVRHHANEFEIDPDRIGVTGGSSGGHLSLMLATLGGPGSADAEDPVDRESSAIQAVAVFFPVTDLLNLGDSTENLRNGGPPKSFVKAFGPDSSNLAKWKVIGRSMSPIFHIGPNLPPILIHHGGADTLVPLDQSQRFKDQADQSNLPVTLVIRPGKKHGWLTMFIDIAQFAIWFDQKLQPNLAINAENDDGQ